MEERHAIPDPSSPGARMARPLEDRACNPGHCPGPCTPGLRARGCTEPQEGYRSFSGISSRSGQAQQRAPWSHEWLATPCRRAFGDRCESQTATMARRTRLARGHWAIIIELCRRTVSADPCVDGSGAPRPIHVVVEQKTSGHDCGAAAVRTMNPEPPMPQPPTGRCGNTAG